MSNQNLPFNSNIPAIPQEEQYDLVEGDDLQLNPQLEGVNTTQASEGETTLPDEDSDWSFGTQENPGPMTLAELQGGAGKKKKKKTATKKKTAKKKTAKKKTAKKKTAKKKTATKKKTEEKKSTGFFGLFKGGKDKEKKSRQFIAPMQRLL